MQELHQGHPGITRIKSLVRGFVWWPGMDHELEEMVKSCPNCQVHQKSPAVAPVHPWEWPQCPWTRLCIDYVRKMFLITMDVYSRWIDTQVVSATTSHKTIELLHSLFSTHDIPAVIVTDNAPFSQVTNLPSSHRRMTFAISKYPHTTLPLMEWQRERSKSSKMN